MEDGQQVGPSTGQLVEAILAAKRHPEQGYRSCLGILRLAKTYPAERMEAAARRCLRARAYNFVFSPDGAGLLIHTSEANSIGLGGRRTKRSGCA